jgi:hypothetical protein
VESVPARPLSELLTVVNKLAAYTWNLVGGYANDFVVRATEAQEDGELRSADFRSRDGFQRG